MEFCEKLQNLRKEEGLTQEELAEALFVSRTAVSKWESGRGYPGIDSLKEISKYFSVTIDDLLSGEKLISIAEKENKASIQKLCGFLSGIIDLISLLLIILPLYPKTVDGQIYSVSLFEYIETTAFNLTALWILYVSLAAVGIIRILAIKKERIQKTAGCFSFALGTVTVIFLSLAGETYSAVLAFLLLFMKTALYLKIVKSN